jgi:hypothetical protein
MMELHFERLLKYAVQSQQVELAAHDLDLGAVYPNGTFIIQSLMSLFL